MALRFFQLLLRLCLFAACPSFLMLTCSTAARCPRFRSLPPYCALCAQLQLHQPPSLQHVLLFPTRHAEARVSRLHLVREIPFSLRSLHHAAFIARRYVCSVAATIITKQLFHRADIGPDVLTLCQFLIGAALSMAQILASPVHVGSSASRFSFRRFWPSSIASPRLLMIALV